jgi:hypothetical protein
MDIHDNYKDKDKDKYKDKDNELICNDLVNNLKKCIEDDENVSKNSFLFASTNQFLFYPINCSNLNVLENEFKKKDINLFLSKSYYSHYAYNVIFDKNDNSVRVYQFNNKK